MGDKIAEIYGNVCTYKRAGLDELREESLHARTPD